MEGMKQFMLGASTAAYQVEGNNVQSDFWVMEQLEHSSFKERSGDAVDHYHRYEEDIKLMKAAGLNAYRFSIEWARVEPEKGRYCEAESTITVRFWRAARPMELHRLLPCTIFLHLSG